MVDAVVTADITGISEFQNKRIAQDIALTQLPVDETPKRIKDEQLIRRSAMRNAMQAAVLAGKVRRGELKPGTVINTALVVAASDRETPKDVRIVRRVKPTVTESAWFQKVAGGNLDEIREQMLAVEQQTQGRATWSIGVPAERTKGVPGAGGELVLVWNDSMSGTRGGIDVRG